MKVNWTGFSKKTPAQRLQMLKEKGLLQDEHWQLLDSQQTLPLETANQMSENVLATLALPYSLVPDFLVDGKSYQVPFVTEEPSVVAAASFAAKIIKRSGGFKTEVHKRQMIGQIALYQLDKAEQAIKDVLRKKKELPHPPSLKKMFSRRTSLCPTLLLLKWRLKTLRRPQTTLMKPMT